MTRFRYTLASIIQSFGLHRKLKRMTNAAYELHLMQEGEEFLGALCWPKVEKIEDIAMQYWNIRKIERKRAELTEQIQDSERVLYEAHTKRAAAADKSKDIGQELFNDCDGLFELLETLKNERETIMTDAQQVKRRFEALKTKASVLKDEGDTSSVSYTKNREQLENLKEDFKNFKEKLSKIDDKINIDQDKLTILQSNIDDKLKSNKDKASETFGQISAANREITAFKAKLGLLDEEHAGLCREVGRYLNLNARLDECQGACKEHLGLLKQINLLRRSIQWNKTLVERAG
ncbi:hypothetical protein N9051_00445 [Akkermansiaceae bacterium]|nr:hypothetical protein [Akkermansiaceae bacterium]